MPHVDLYFTFGQSNAKIAWWGDKIHAALQADRRVGNPQTVSTTHPGDGLAQWFTTSPQANYEADIYDGLGGGDLEAAIAAIEAAGNTWRLRGFFGFQGETDIGSETDTSLWATRLPAMIDRLKTDFGITYDVNVTLAVVDLNQDPFYDDPANVPTGDTREEVTALRDEQFGLAAASNIIVVDTREYTRSDAWHLTESELERLADNMVEAHLAAFPVGYTELLADADFHDEWALQDDAAGTTVASESGSNDATLSGASNTADITVAGPAGRFAKALQLGSGAKVSIPQLPQAATSDPCTVLLYWRADAVDATQDDVFTTTDDDATLSISTNATEPWQLFGSADHWDFIGRTLETAKWYKVAIRYNNGEVDMRVNRVNYTGGKTGTPAFDFSGATIIGGDTREAAVSVANFGFFTRELTDAETDEWFNDGTVKMSDPIFDINTNDDISDTGGLIDSFGNFTASDTWKRPTISTDATEDVLGFPRADFASNSRLENDAYAVYFNGDDPEFTHAEIVYANAEALNRVILSAGNATNNAYDSTNFFGTDQPTTLREDDAASSGTTQIGTAVDDGAPYLVITRQEGTQRTIFVRNLITGAEASNTSTIDLGTATMTKVLLGGRYRNGAESLFWRGGIYRVALYSTAIPGDETDYAGTEFGDLVVEMLQPADGPRTRTRTRKRSRRRDD